jgi:hypothetical protein
MLGGNTQLMSAMDAIESTCGAIDAMVRMTTGDEDGNVYIWDPNLEVKSAATTKEGCVGPAGHLKFHKDKIVSICVAPGPDPLQPKPRLVTVSACNRIGVWDLFGSPIKGGTSPAASINLPLIGKLKPKDITVTGACALLAGAFQPVHTGVLLATSGPQVYGLDLATYEVQLIANLTGQLPPRDTKKGAKLYGIAAAALHPHVAAVASNAGAGLLHSPSTSSYGVAGLPMVAAFQPHSRELLRLDSQLNTRSASVVYVIRNKVLGALFVASTDEEDTAEPGALQEREATAAGPDLTTVAMPLLIKQSARYALHPQCMSRYCALLSRLVRCTKLDLMMTNWWGWCCCL